MKTLLNIVLLFILLIVISITIYFFKSSKNNITYTPGSKGIGEVIEFTGNLTDFDKRCEVDMACVAYIDGKEVITNPGDTGEVSKLGISEVWDKNVGDTVKVRAIKTGINTFTLVGDDTLFVKVINK